MSTGYRPAWYRALGEWAEHPSPANVWLYRGQAARYESTLPSLARHAYRRFYGVPLHDLDWRVVDGVLSASPVLGPGRLHPSTQALGPVETAALRYFSGIPTWVTEVTQREIVRALAQHYGFPTLFIDLSLDPFVAAFFATHAHSNGRYFASDDPGVVYRWPAKRLSATRVAVPAEEDRGAAGEDVQAIDLTRISPYARRPRNQRAVLARVVTLPFGPVPPAPLVVPLEACSLVDMSKLACCERFVLPPGAGRDLDRLVGTSGDAMFPDRIDLAYSYVSILAFFSLAAHDPDQYPGGLPREQRAAGRSHFSAALDCARSILQYERTRLVPGQHLSAGTRLSLIEARAAVAHVAELARQAVLLGSDPEEAQQLDADLAWALRAVKDEWERRLAAWEASVRKVTGEATRVGDDSPSADDPAARRPPPEWVLPEIDRRLARVEEILATAGFAPAYALDVPDRHRALLDALPSDRDYEEEVRRLIAAQRSWLRDDDVFPARRPDEEGVAL